MTWAPERTVEIASIIAHHEAGHAAARWGLGLPIAEVTIIPEGKFGGQCRTARLSLRHVLQHWDNPRRLLPKFLAGTVGGKVAQEIYTGQRYEWSDWWFSIDVESIQRLSDTFELGDLWDGRVQEVEATTGTFLRNVWPAVEELAGALLEQGTVEGGEACRIMAAALRTSDPSTGGTQ